MGELVASTTLGELELAISIIVKLSNYLPENIRKQHPDITSLIFCLHNILENKISPPVGIIYDKKTKLFSIDNTIGPAGQQAGKGRFYRALTIRTGGRMVFHDGLC